MTARVPKRALRRSDPLGPPEPNGVSVLSVDEVLRGPNAPATLNPGDLPGAGGPSAFMRRKYARYGITKRTMYETLDGVKHSTFAEAIKHVGLSELTTWVGEWLDDHCEHGELRATADDLARDLHRDWLVTKRPEKKNGE